MNLKRYIPFSRLRHDLVIVGLLLLLSGLVFRFVERRLSGPLFALGVNPEILGRLEASLDDQRRLAAADPENETLYRHRFDDTRTLVQRLRILEHGRGDVERRYRQILLAAFAFAAMLAGGGVVLRQSRYEGRLSRLRAALADLAAGSTDVTIDDRRRDTIGRIAAMIEHTSRIMARDKRRLAALQNLSAWQESARRHAHEIRTPLTGARLELTRLDGLLATEALSRPGEVRDATRSVLQELERLGRFTQDFTSFARVPRPELEVRDLATLAADFTTTFESAWPNLELRLKPDPPGPGPSFTAVLDRDMIRRVLVNLCDNSSLAKGDGQGRVTLTLSAEDDAVRLDVADDGPGIDAKVRSRLFEPYTTTRRIGQGMGLGLAISKKIMLDLGGDLELLASSPAGATFRLSFTRRLSEPPTGMTAPKTSSCGGASRPNPTLLAVGCHRRSGISHGQQTPSPEETS